MSFNVRLKQTWTSLKAIKTLKNLRLQYEDESTQYYVFCQDGQVLYDCFINKETPASTDQTDFETNFQTDANKKIIVQNAPFAASQVEFRGDGILGTAIKNVTTAIDYKLPENLYVNGGEIYTEDGVVNDYINVEVIDIDGIIGPPGTVIKQWIKKWYVIPSQIMRIKTAQAGLIVKDLYLRVNYTSTGNTNNVKVIVNYFLNKPIE